MQLLFCCVGKDMEMIKIKDFFVLYNSACFIGFSMAMLELKEAFYRGIICKQYVSVAQWIERRFPKPCVGCSNRLWDTKSSPVMP